MDYTECVFNVKEPFSDILIASLSDLKFDSFITENDCVKAYILTKDFKVIEIRNLDFVTQNNIEFSYRQLPYVNWNQKWEENFNAITVAEQVYIRADFHPKKDFKYQITINPKMSFGTGHHATTSMVIQGMLEYDFSNLNVLDMGCGTAVLAILAIKLGAKQATAIDYDKYAIENAIENIGINNCHQIETFVGEDDIIPIIKYDAILANINKNILLKQLPTYSNRLINGGTLFLSGFYLNDKQEILDKAQAFGFIEDTFLSIDDWCMLKLNLVDA